ncbi:hypothetical protein Hdeb2414_s0020g00556931 [Helianthus debilis subsp. tardiflorus]
MKCLCLVRSVRLTSVRLTGGSPIERFGGGGFEKRSFDGDGYHKRHGDGGNFSSFSLLNENYSNSGCGEEFSLSLC